MDVQVGCILGGIIPIPLPAGPPRPGPGSSYEDRNQRQKAKRRHISIESLLPNDKEDLHHQFFYLRQLPAEVPLQTS
jgi:hypothetical protein